MGFDQNTAEAPLTEALLGQEHQVILEEGQPTPDVAKSSSLDTVWNLTNVILGAGK
jgi:hypothetical protein